MGQKPPYTITEKAADALAKIVESITRLEYGTGFKHDIRLHRENRVRTIHSSLAIEGNTLTLFDVTAVIDGKRIAGMQSEIKEIKNAYEAYDHIMSFDPYEVKDFLRAHQLMTEGLVKEAGRFRSKDVGVFDGDVVIHIGARPQYVPQLITDLFDWAKTSDLHPVLKSAVLHYEIEMIHPFADGNGRMGRLWQTLVLAKWNPVFTWIPMESILYQNRPEYYSAIEASRSVDNSGAFIEFTLSSLLESISEQVKLQETANTTQAPTQVPTQVILSGNDKAILLLLYDDPTISQNKIAITLGWKRDRVKYYMNKMKKDKIIKRIGSSQKGYWEVLADSEK